MTEEYYIGQIFEEIYPPEAASWCGDNNAKIIELEPETREVEETYTEQVPVEKEIVVPAEYDNEGNVIVEEHTETITEYEEQEKTRTVEVTVRRFEIVAIPEPPAPTEEEQRQKRAEAYRLEKDPITCQITSLRDEEQTPDVVEEINELLQKRTEVVKDIQERYPYPVDNDPEYDVLVEG